MDALTFITCGSVDDGKSTLIGRLLVDSKAVLQDHLAGVTRAGATDLALLTDGLSAEREQGITIDVAYRYFSTEQRKFIIGDAPGHEQYTRNMVTAASSADAAVVLVDAAKLDWRDANLELLPQTRRHSLLVQLLRVPTLVFAINKLDAVDDANVAYAHIRGALERFAAAAKMEVAGIVPISALEGWNVVTAGDAGWCGYNGPTLLQLLEALPNRQHRTDLPFALPVQWVEKRHDSADTSKGRRVFWGRVAAGQVQVGDSVSLFPGGRTATVAEVLNTVRDPQAVAAGHSAGVVLDQEVDVSRGDWLLAAPVAGDDDFAEPQPSYPSSQNLTATVAWMDDMPLMQGRVYWLLHGHRWVKAKVRSVVHNLNIHTLEEEPASELGANAIGQVDLLLQEAVPQVAYAQSRAMGAMILVDTASHSTAGAVLVQ